MHPSVFHRWSSARISRMFGRLASGVAHEINNPLSGLKNCLYAIDREPENYAQTRLYLQLMKEGMEYIETVVQQLLGFARQHPATMVAVEINSVVEKVIRLLDFNLRKRRIELRMELAPDLPELRGDPQMLSEVFMNILLNAIDAVDDRGHITVSSTRDNGEVRVCIEDDGMGFAAEHLAHIYDPFFTTKSAGEGTGLGLSICREIVTRLGGEISAGGGSGHGLCVTIMLPLKGDKKSTKYEARNTKQTEKRQIQKFKTSEQNLRFAV
jgi:two-component system NtrC family sensor kinase